MLWLDCACMMGSSETGWDASTKYVIHCIKISYHLFSFCFSFLFVFSFIQEIHLTKLYILSPWFPFFLQIVVSDQSFCFCKFWQRKSCLQIAVNCLCKHCPNYQQFGQRHPSWFVMDPKNSWKVFIPVISDQAKWTLILSKTIFWAPGSAWGCCCGWQALRARRSAAGHCGGASVPS